MELLKFKEIFNYKAIILDLDDTLYEERAFLFPAYKKISDYISNKSGNKAAIYESYLINSFETSGRSHLFDRLINDFQLHELITTAELLDILRNHVVALTFRKNIDSIMEELINSGKKLFILTNGHPIQQRNKITGLNIPTRFPMITVIYANEFKPKPSPYCVNQIIKEYNLNNTDVLLVGDSDIDKLTAEQAFINFLNISKITDYGIE